MVRTGVLVALAACAATPPALKATPLTRSTPIERAIRNGETHRYAVDLPADSVLFADVEQLGADVTVTTYDPAGSRLASFDSPTGNKGLEHVRIDAARSGTYRIDVGTFPGPSGRYRVRVVEVITRQELAEREHNEQAAIAKFFTDRQAFVDAFVAWARQTAIGDDFAGLDAMIASAQVIALGEADHGIVEYLAYRNRMFEYLVEKQQVTALLVESGVTETTLVDDYVMGATSVVPREAAAALFMWGMPAATQTNLELINWLRAHNAKAARRVHVYGIDVTGGRDGLFTESRRAVDAALAYLAKVAPTAHASLQQRLAPLMPSFTTAGYLDLDRAHRAELRSAIEALVDAFTRLPDSAALRRARQHAAMAAVVERILRTTVDRSSKDNLADVGLDGIRDETMAANVMWTLAEEGANSRLFLFAHNAHVRRGPALAWPSNIRNTSMGQHLAKGLDARYLVIGAVHGDGPPTTTLDSLFAKIGRPSFLLDLRGAPTSVRAGLDQSWDLRLDGFRALGLKPSWTADPLRCFDALVFTATSTNAPLVP